MDLLRPVTNADKPVITFDFTLFCRRIGASDVTVSGATVAIALATDISPGGASDPAYPDPAPSLRLDGSVDFGGSPYARQRLNGLVEGADYIVSCTATFSDGSKETLQGRIPARDQF